MSSVHASGYGLFFLPGKTRNAAKAKAHRVSYQLSVGPIPEGMDVLHRCDVRACVNPRHLYLGTDAENARDRVERGREGDRSRERNGRVKLTSDQIAEIRFGYDSGATQVALAETFGISQGQVSRIIRGVQWKLSTVSG